MSDLRRSPELRPHPVSTKAVDLSDLQSMSRWRLDVGLAVAYGEEAQRRGSGVAAGTTVGALAAVPGSGGRGPSSGGRDWWLGRQICWVGWGRPVAGERAGEATTPAAGERVGEAAAPALV